MEATKTTKFEHDGKEFAGPALAELLHRTLGYAPTGWSIDHGTGLPDAGVRTVTRMAHRGPEDTPWMEGLDPKPIHVDLLANEAFVVLGGRETRLHWRSDEGCLDAVRALEAARIGEALERRERAGRPPVPEGHYRLVLHMTDEAWMLVPAHEALGKAKRRGHRTLSGWHTVTFRVPKGRIGAALTALDPALDTGGVDKKASRMYLDDND